MKIDVSHVAKLANLPLSDAEKEKLATQLEETITYVDQLEKIPTSKVKPTSQVTGLENVLREDIVRPSLTQAEALANASKVHNGYIVVPAILENDQ